MINKRIYFFGFKPVQWVLILCVLFMVGFFFWWVAVLLFVPVYMVGRNLSRANAAGNPDLLTGLIVWNSMKKYFVDREGVFGKLD